MSDTPIQVVLLRGGGDLASGVALRLWRAGLRVMVTEIAQPLAVRRLVSCAQAVYSQKMQLEDLQVQRAADPAQAYRLLQAGIIPVLVDPDCQAATAPQFEVLALVDGRMRKRPPEENWFGQLPLVIGLGPGFTAGLDCDAVIETNRGHYLGRVIWQGSAQPDTGMPEAVTRYQGERVLRAPQDGILQTYAEIGDSLKSGDRVAAVNGYPVLAPFDGLLRGLLYPGLTVKQGWKIGDLDPRNEPRFARLVSEKSLAIGGAVLEALLTKAELRSRICC